MNKNSEIVRRWEKDNPEHFRESRRRRFYRYNHRYPDKRHFTVTVHYRVKSGYITKQPCSVCGGTDHLQACTLSKSPDNPVWFCYSCHKIFHDLISRFGIVKHIG